MALPTLATVDDVQTFVPTVMLDATQTDALLRLASAQARAYTGCRWANEDGTALEDVPDGVPEVVASIVARAILNPRGVTQETAGPYTVSYGSDAAARIYLAGTDKAILDANRCRSRLCIMTLTRGELETPAVRDCWDEF